MKQLKIVLVEDREVRGAGLAQALKALGHQVLELEPTRLSPALIQSCAPDLAMINVTAPDDRLVHRLAELNRECARPIVMFAKYSETVLISAAVKAGVSALIVDGLRFERLPAIIEVALARFNEAQALQTQLERANASLIERKDIERAKAILMRRRNLEESLAYQALRKMATDRGKHLSEVAHSIIAAEELLARR